MPPGSTTRSPTTLCSADGGPNSPHPLPLAAREAPPAGAEPPGEGSPGTRRASSLQSLGEYPCGFLYVTKCCAHVTLSDISGPLPLHTRGLFLTNSNSPSEGARPPRCSLSPGHQHRLHCHLPAPADHFVPMSRESGAVRSKQGPLSVTDSLLRVTRPPGLGVTSAARGPP